MIATKHYTCSDLTVEECSIFVRNQCYINVLRTIIRYILEYYTKLRY